MSTERMPDGLQLVVNALEWHAACGYEYKTEIDTIRAEHAQRVTLQHHACDQAQRIADLEAKCATLKRLHDAATAERDELRTKVADLERAAVKRREISDGVEAELADECDTLRIVNRKVEAERDELRARLAEIEGQEPVDVQVRVNNPLCTWQRPDTTHDEPTILARAQYLCGNWPKRYSMRLLYARPVPAIPEGWRLVPEEPTPEMIAAAKEGDEKYSLRSFGPGVFLCQGGEDHWSAMITAAPEAAR